MTDIWMGLNKADVRDAEYRVAKEMATHPELDPSGWTVWRLG